MIHFNRFMEELDKLNVNISNGKPALKKPLLLLLVLSKLEQGLIKENRITFDILEKELRVLIQLFGGRATPNGPKPFPFA